MSLFHRGDDNNAHEHDTLRDKVKDAGEHAKDKLREGEERYKAIPPAKRRMGRVTGGVSPV